MLDKIVLIIGLIMIFYWILQIVFIVLHKRWSAHTTISDYHDKNVSVSIIHPIKDKDFELKKNLECWAKQDYLGPIEHIFSFQEAMDPAIDVVRTFIVENKQIDAKIIINPTIYGLNGKSSNMVNGVKVARYTHLLFVDSDIRVNNDFIQKMIRPLSIKKNGATTCGQINIGGTHFWSRFFTYFQNNETIFNWALITKLGIPLGLTGASFAIKAELLDSVGGLESFGDSLLEDLHLGQTLTEKGYKLILGPFLECYVDEIKKENSINYAKRLAVGIQTHIAQQLPVFIVLVFWYWILFFISLASGSIDIIIFSIILIVLRVIHGLLQRITTYNKIKPVDFIIPLFYDWFATFYLTFFLFKIKRSPLIIWRGIRYKVKKGGYIDSL